ncbi:MAG TPA: HAMP domain-containing histidine kinase [Desulfobacterales bacterium]|nr:HAMP domain-containing histidine kinase [Desulfobacterales bacterium]
MKKQKILWTKKMTTDSKSQKKHPKKSDSPERFFQEINVEFLIHELKGPISIVETGLRSLLERKEKYGPLSTRQEKTLKRAAKNIKKTREMVNGLLEIGRSEAGACICCRFQPSRTVHEVVLDGLETALGAIFDESKEDWKENEMYQFFSENGVFLDISPRVNNIEMLQDETKFRQIFLNLVTNALFYRKKRVEIKMRMKDDQLLLEITDDGPGIKPEHHDTVFKQYTQIQGASSELQRKGHGLGLAGALILSRCLGGNIQIKSDKEKGTTFCLTLPIRLENSARLLTP